MQLFELRDLSSFYKKLQDDESRAVFNERLGFFLDGDYEHIWRLSDKLFDMGYFCEEIKELIHFKSSGYEIALYGAGTVGRYAKLFFQRHGLHVDFFIDRNKKKQKDGYQHLPVISLQTFLLEHAKDSVVVITASHVYANGIKQELHQLKIAYIYDFFVNYQVLNYFNCNVLKPVENEIFIDCGVLDGDTIKEFLSFTKGNYKKIIGFEPDTKSFHRACNYILENKIEYVELINKGVYSKTGEFLFYEQGDGGSHISENGSVKIPITTIDETVGEEMITLIKMDIEGAEKEALKGASAVIKKCRPRLAVCVYHKPEDIIEIPIFLSRLVPEYKYYLRHNEFGNGGTVLYAIEG